MSEMLLAPSASKNRIYLPLELNMPCVTAPRVTTVTRVIRVIRVIIFILSVSLRIIRVIRMI